MLEGYIHSLESFGTVDGPGTRFVVFFQGCNLRCQYCHNPDTWEVNCSTKMTAEQILSEYKQVSEFITGGITVTGGDPLLQLPFLVELLTLAKSRGINTCVDTSGGLYSPKNQRQAALLEKLLEVTDLFLLDIKHIDNAEHKKLTGVHNEKILAFARYLSDNNARVWIRHVVIPTITLNDNYLYKLGEFLAELTNIDGIEILPYHTMALPKYESMNIEYPLKGIPAATKAEAERARKIVLLARQNKLKELNSK